MAYLRQEEGDISQELMALNQIMADFTEATESSYRQERQLLEEKEERLRQDYQKKSSAIEQAMSDCHAQRRHLLG